MNRFKYIILIPLILSGCSDLCSNDVVIEKMSPNKDAKLVIFIRNCGTTTDYSTHLSVLKKNKHINSKNVGNILIADTDHGKADAWEYGGPAVDAYWINDHEISIRISRKARLFKSKTQPYGVIARYEYY